MFYSILCSRISASCRLVHFLSNINLQQVYIILQWSLIKIFFCVNYIIVNDGDISSDILLIQR